MTATGLPIRPAGMVEVTKEEFFERIGPLDVHPSNRHPEFTVWETRGRQALGWSLPGWRSPPGTPKQYALREGR